MNKKIVATLFFFLIALLPGCGHAGQQGHNPTEARETRNSSSKAFTADNDVTAFSKGFKLFEKERYRKACPQLYQYLTANSPDDVDYEWAAFFFGISLEKRGFSHAAVDILANLVMRKPNPKIVSYCLELFEDISRSGPFDKDLVISQVICDQEYEFAEDKISDFVNFHQGVFDRERGFLEWADDHFRKIASGTYYYFKYLYQEALYRIYQDQIDHAIGLLEEILEATVEAERLKDETRRTLARLLYEKGRFEEADRMYRESRESIVERGHDLLEMAWSQYRMKNAEKAMGLLYAFKAPSFRYSFTPEYYILKSFIYKDVCYYQDALDVVYEFKERYAGSLENVYERGDPLDDQDLSLVLLNKKRIGEIWGFLKLLEREKARCTEIQDKPLRKYVENIYALQIQESVDYLREQIQKEYEKIANELLRYEEDANLMEYEIGLDMSQRVYENHYSGDVLEDKKSEDRVVVYPFQGEFWNDELAGYKVALPNKCGCMEKWGEFFK